MTLISPKIKHIPIFLLDSFLTTKLVGSHKIKQIEQNPDDISIHLSSFIHQELKFSTKFQNPNTIYKKR